MPCTLAVTFASIAMMLGKALKITVPTKITLTVGASGGSMNHPTMTSVAKQSLKSNKLALY